MHASCHGDTHLKQYSGANTDCSMSDTRQLLFRRAEWPVLGQAVLQKRAGTSCVGPDRGASTVETNQQAIVADTTQANAWCPTLTSSVRANADRRALLTLGVKIGV